MPKVMLTMTAIVTMPISSGLDSTALST